MGASRGTIFAREPWGLGISAQTLPLFPGKLGLAPGSLSSLTPVSSYFPFPSRGSCLPPIPPFLPLFLASWGNPAFPSPRAMIQRTEGVSVCPAPGPEQSFFPFPALAGSADSYSHLQGVPWSLSWVCMAGEVGVAGEVVPPAWQEMVLSLHRLALPCSHPTNPSKPKQRRCFM